MDARAVGRARIELVRGDLTREATDAIVNAANDTLLGGGGVDGAIHRAAGPDLLAACRALPKRGGVRCPPGEVRSTGAFDLPCRYVIHGVGPQYARLPEPEARRLLVAVHRAALDEAARLGCHRVAFPAISCGVYGYPLDEAAPIALGTTADWLRAQAGFRVRVAGAPGNRPRRVRFVLFGDAAYAAFSRALDGLTA